MPRLEPLIQSLTELGLQCSEGAFGGACEWPARSLELFPRDHLRDIMESFATYPSGGLPEVLPFALGTTWTYGYLAHSD